MKASDPAPHTQPVPEPPALAIRRRMSGRDMDEPHRASSALEALFDLTTVVAVAAAASRLHHDIAHAQYVQGIVDLLCSFFAVWWSWMNFAWFSSAYDTDDVAYRLATVVKMVGVLLMAVGLTQEDGAQVTQTLGYTVMRVALVPLWLRAAREHPERRTTCRRYALSLSVLQVLWLMRIFLIPTAWGLPSFVMLAVLELAVPPWSERAGETPWHPHHIAERYSLFTIILLGECMVAAANAMGGVLSTQGWSVSFIVLSFSIVSLIVGLWWTYFLVLFAQVLHLRRERAFLWGYGHALVFVALAALDGVLEVVVDVLKTGGVPVEGAAHAGPSPLLAIVLVAATVMFFLSSLWWLGAQTTRRTERSPLFLLPSLLLTGLTIIAVMQGLPLPWGVFLIAACPALLIAIVMRRRHLQPPSFAVR